MSIYYPLSHSFNNNKTMIYKIKLWTKGAESPTFLGLSQTHYVYGIAWPQANKGENKQWEWICWVQTPPPLPPGGGGVGGGGKNWPDLRHQPGIQSSFDWRGNMDILRSPFQILALTSLPLFPSFPPFIQIHSLLLHSFLTSYTFFRMISFPPFTRILLSYIFFRFLSFSFHSFIPFSPPIRLISFIPCSSFRQMFSFLFCLMPIIH